MKNILIGVLVFVAMINLASAANCNQTITTNTILTTDLNCPDSNGINFGADSITLDCNGHYINGMNIYHHAVFIDGKDSVTVKNCVLKNFLGQGIALMSSDNALIQDNTIQNNGNGIVTVGVFGATFTGNKFLTNVGRGVLVGFSSGNTFYNNIFSNNGNSNAYEYFSNGNYWNYGTIGNTWSDYSGSGYYYINGEGDGVDYYPRQSKIRKEILKKE